MIDCWQCQDLYSGRNCPTCGAPVVRHQDNQEKIDADFLGITASKEKYGTKNRFEKASDIFSRT